LITSSPAVTTVTEGQYANCSECCAGQPPISPTPTPTFTPTPSPTVGTFVPPFTITVSSTQPTCNSNVPDGKIIVNPPTNGTPPFSAYSINNGLTYQLSPIFVGLSQGTYTVVAKDSIGQLSNIVTVNLLTAPSVINYSLTINGITNAIQTGNISNTTLQRYKQILKTDFTINVNPQIPVGESITFKVNVNETSNIKPFLYAAGTSPGTFRVGDSYGYGLQITKNGIPLTPVNTTTVIPPPPNPSILPNSTGICEDKTAIAVGQSIWSQQFPFISTTLGKDFQLYQSSTTTTYNITIQNGDTITGTIYSLIEESVFASQKYPWYQPNSSTLIQNNFLNCETLINNQIISINYVTDTLDSCSNVSVNNNYTVKNDVYCFRNPNDLLRCNGTL
jgi:hypothetical protein